MGKCFKIVVAQNTAKHLIYFTTDYKCENFQNASKYTFKGFTSKTNV